MSLASKAFTQIFGLLVVVSSLGSFAIEAKAKGQGEPGVIPEGFTTTELEASNVAALGGFVSDNSKVDVLWMYHDARGGEAKVSTLAASVNVISVDQKSNAKLLVTNQQAKLIDLAKQAGVLSLLLISNQPNQIDEPKVLTFKDLFSGKSADISTKIQGPSVFQQDPKTGKVVNSIFEDEEWLLKELI